MSPIVPIAILAALIAAIAGGKKKPAAAAPGETETERVYREAMAPEQQDLAYLRQAADYLRSKGQAAMANAVAGRIASIQATQAAEAAAKAEAERARQQWEQANGGAPTQAQLDAVWAQYQTGSLDQATLTYAWTLFQTYGTPARAAAVQASLDALRGAAPVPVVVQQPGAPDVTVPVAPPAPPPSTTPPPAAPPAPPADVRGPNIGFELPNPATKPAGDAVWVPGVSGVPAGPGVGPSPGIPGHWEQHYTTQPVPPPPAPSPAQPAPVAAPAGPHTYTVKSGDTGSTIAAKATGSAARWTELRAVNPKVMASSPALVTKYGFPIYAGDVITLPDSWFPAAAPAAPAPGTSPVTREETTPAADPNGTVRLARDLIGVENTSGWKTALATQIRDWQIKMGSTVVGSADGKLGEKSIYRMALEVGVLPRVRYWPKGSVMPGELTKFRDQLYTIAANLDDNGKHEQAAALRVSAAAETGQGYPSSPSAIPLEQREAEAMAVAQAIANATG